MPSVAEVEDLESAVAPEHTTSSSKHTKSSSEHTTSSSPATTTPSSITSTSTSSYLSSVSADTHAEVQNSIPNSSSLNSQTNGHPGDAANGLSTADHSSTHTKTNHSLAPDDLTTPSFLGWTLNACTSTTTQPLNDIQLAINKFGNIKDFLKNTCYTFTDLLDNCRLSFYFNSSKNKTESPVNDIAKKLPEHSISNGNVAPIQANACSMSVTNNVHLHNSTHAFNSPIIVTHSATCSDSVNNVNLSSTLDSSIVQSTDSSSISSLCTSTVVNNSLRPRRAAALKCKQALDTRGGDGGMSCACGLLCKSRLSLSMHRRNCDLVKRLLIQPVNELDSNIERSIDNDDLKFTSSSSNSNQKYQNIADKESLDLNNLNEITLKSNCVVNNVFVPTHSDTVIANENSASADKMQQKNSLQPLDGVFLPKTKKDWEEMNAFMHSSSLFRLAHGKIGDLNSAASEFNHTIYGYLKSRHGTLKGTKKVVSRGGVDYTALDLKYQSWSKSRIRRELNKLKHREPVTKGSPICDEIIYLSRRLRQDLKSGSLSSKPVCDKNFGSSFWETCKNVFAGVTGAIPEFNITQCGDYFARILSISDSARNYRFPLPHWFIQLPVPTFPLDTSPPSYAEIANIIRKCRAGSSACPLDQISVLSLKKCPILRTILHNIITCCWQSQYTPEAWRVGVTILLYKKGDPTLVENFRPITLQSVPYKIFSSFIRNRLQTFLDVNKYHNNNIQKGFAHGQDGVLEHTEMLDFIMRDAKRTHRSYFVVLLDLRNAFGEVQHNLIRSSLRYHHVPESFIRVFDSIYSDFGIAVSSGGLLTDKILVKRGVLQGDPCSPLFFNLCFNSLMRLLETPQYKQLGYY